MAIVITYTPEDEERFTRKFFEDPVFHARFVNQIASGRDWRWVVIMESGKPITQSRLVAVINPDAPDDFIKAIVELARKHGYRVIAYVADEVADRILKKGW